MSLLSGGTNSSANKQLMGYYPQSSIYGTCIPVLYGTMRTTGNVINTFGWFSQAAGSGGKLGGKGSGGKGGGTYNYWTGFIEGICNGPVEAILTVWLDRTVYEPSAAVESITVPSSGIFAVSNPGFFANMGVSMLQAFTTTASDYGAPGSATVSGNQLVPLQLVPGTPGPGQYSVSTAGVYTFNAADYGVTVDIGYGFTALGGAAIAPPVVLLKFDLFLGGQGQLPWSYATAGLTQLGYTQLAYIAIQQYPLSTSGLIPNLSFEVMGKCIFGGAGVLDCDPTAIFADFICSASYGPNFKSSLLGSLTEVSTWCVANSIFCSALMDSQRSAASWLGELLTIANAEAVWSDGTLKLRSRGDTTVTANGVTFSPTTQPIYDLDDDDFIAKPGEEPVEFDLGTAQDAYNSLKVEWSNRGNGYQAEPVPAQDDYAIGLYGIREASQISLHGITEHTVAAKTAQIQLKRLVYERGTAKFTLGTHYCLLEPMDMVTLTDPEIGWAKQPFRIISIDEDDQGQLAIEATIFPWSISQPTLHPKQTTGGYVPAYYAQPGNVNAPIFFEAPEQMTQQIGLVIFILLSGGLNFGGCSVWESSDGATYDYVARYTARSVDGVATSALPWSADPDTTDTLNVDLVDSIGALESYSNANADRFESLAVIDQELIAYTTATLGAGYQYALSGYMRRGVFGTYPTSHHTGARFGLLDGSEFQDTYQTTDIGKTRWYKFTAFNLAGQQEQDISTVTAYPWTILAPFGRGPMPWRPDGQRWRFAQSGASLQLTAMQGSTGKQTINILGYPPVNVVSPSITAPSIDPVAVVTYDAASFLPSGSFVAQVFAYDSVGSVPSAGSNFTEFVIPSPGSYSVSFNVVFSPGTSGYEVFAGTDINNLLATTGPQTGAPTSITLTSTSGYFSPIYPGFYGPPDPRAVAIHARAKRVIHGGAAFLTVTASTSNTVTLAMTSAPLANVFNGRYLYPAGEPGFTGIGIDQPALITANNAANPCTFTFGTTIGPTAFTVGTYVLLSLTSGTSGTAAYIADGAFLSAPLGNAGLTPHAEKGNIVRILYDANNTPWGATATVLDNDASSYTTTPFLNYEGVQVTPGPHAVWIVEEPVWRVDSVTTQIRNSIMPTPTSGPASAIVVASLPSDTIEGYVALIQALAQDASGIDSDETPDALHMIYVVPAVAPGSGYGPLLVPGLNGVVPIDLNNGASQRLVLPATLNSGAVAAGAIVITVSASIYDSTACPFTYYWDDGTGESGTCSAISGDAWTVSGLVNAHANNAPIALPVTFGIIANAAPGAGLDLYFDQPIYGYCPAPNFITGVPGGYVSSIAGSFSVSPLATTRTWLGLKLHDSNLWCVDNFSTGGGIT